MAEHLTKDEFLAHVTYIREDIAAVHARLDTLNGRTRTLETAVAVLQDRSSEAKATGRAAGAGAGAVIGGILIAVWQYFGAGK